MFVVDTNVAVVANQCCSPQAELACVLACINALEDITHRGKIVLDKQFRGFYQSRILDEYMGKLSLSGQPGFGDAFLRWAWDNQANPERSEQVEIHFRGNDGEDYEEFPDDSALDKFDPSDRKFVAVALGSKSNPEILNAVDRDWWNYRKELERHGVRIKFLCPGQFGTRRPAG